MTHDIVVNDITLKFDVHVTAMLGHGGAGLQTLTMTNASSGQQVANNAAGTIVQYAQGADGQFFIPGMSPCSAV